MLDDQHVRVLTEMEAHLRRQDPAFVARMTADSVGTSMAPVVLSHAAVLYIATPIVMLLFGWTGLAITVGLLLASLAIIFRRLRRGPAGQT